MYPGIIEYRPQHNVTAVDTKTRTLKFDVQDDVKADVLNVLPLMRAGDLIVKAGLADANGRWSTVNYLNFESTKAKDVHIIGDSIQVAPLMPKSGHMANQHAKVAAAAIIQLLRGEPVNPTPVVMNTCYSFVTERDVIHVASVHQYDAVDKTVKPVPGSGGVSAGANQIEGRYALAWAQNIWADALAG
jgi:NADH dehydrogenase FAD-containing subunit